MGGWHGRFEAIFRAAGALIPALFEKTAHRLMVPVLIDEAWLSPVPIGRGRAVTVFGFDGCNRVVKVYRHSLGLSDARLDGFELAVRANLEHMQKYYAEIPDLLLPTSLVQLESPVLGMPAVVLLQDRVTHSISDFFLDYADEQILELMRRHPKLRFQFESFANATKMSLQQGTHCFDMYGRDNLMLLNDGSEPRLAIGDIGVYDLAERKSKVPGIYSNIEALHSRLFALAEAVQGQR